MNFWMREQNELKCQKVERLIVKNNVRNFLKLDFQYSYFFGGVLGECFKNCR